MKKSDFWGAVGIFIMYLLSLTMIIVSIIGLCISTSNELLVQSILSLILGIVFVIVELALMLNPSYKRWFKMMSVNNDAQSRPKYCYLSVLEFGSLLVYVSSFILLTIACFA